MARASRGNDSCFACGRPPEGPYCCRCGVEQSGTNRRHWSIIRAHEDAARKAVRKALYDRRLYGEQNCPPLTQMVVSVAEALSESGRDGRTDRRFFPAIAGPDGGLCAEKVVDMALGRLEREGR